MRTKFTEFVGIRWLTCHCENRKDLTVKSDCVAIHLLKRFVIKVAVKLLTYFVLKFS